MLCCEKSHKEMQALWTEGGRGNRCVLSQGNVSELFFVSSMDLCRAAGRIAQLAEAGVYRPSGMEVTTSAAVRSGPSFTHHARSPVHSFSQGHSRSKRTYTPLSLKVQEDEIEITCPCGQQHVLGAEAAQSLKGQLTWCGSESDRARGRARGSSLPFLPLQPLQSRAQAADESNQAGMGQHVARGQWIGPEGTSARRASTAADRLIPPPSFFFSPSIPKLELARPSAAVSLNCREPHIRKRNSAD